MKDQLGMSPAIEVRDDDFVIATGQQLHDLARERRLLHPPCSGRYRGKTLDPQKLG